MSLTDKDKQWIEERIDEKMKVRASAIARLGGLVSGGYRENSGRPRTCNCDLPTCKTCSRRKYMQERRKKERLG